MVLNRLGNKRKLADKIVPLFPKHTIYVEPFFGAGGIFFNKPRAKQNFLNDLDNDVYNLWQVVYNPESKAELIELFEMTPHSNEIFQYWRKTPETEPIRKALRFLYLSNLSFLGKMDTLQNSTGEKIREIAISNLKNNNFDFTGMRFMNKDFRDFFKSITFKGNLNETFIYADPPYAGTTSNYSDNFTIDDFNDLIEILVKLNLKFAVSEFDTDHVRAAVEKHNLHLTVIGERKNICNRRTEVLITNYLTNNELF